MDSYEIFHKAIFIRVRNMLSLLGHDVFLENWKPGLVAYVLYAFSVFIGSLLIYTVVVYDNFIRIVCVFYFGMFSQVCSITFISTQKQKKLLIFHCYYYRLPSKYTMLVTVMIFNF